VGDPKDGWVFGASGECWVDQFAARKMTAGITHTSVGTAVPISSNRWKVWTGHRLDGILVQQSNRRFNLYNRRGYFVGYTSGRDGLAAGTARLVLGQCA
jgi:hypothetical protein